MASSASAHNRTSSKGNGRGVSAPTLMVPSVSRLGRSLGGEPGGEPGGELGSESGTDSGIESGGDISSGRFGCAWPAAENVNMAANAETRSAVTAFSSLVSHDSREKPDNRLGRARNVVGRVELNTSFIWTPVLLLLQA